MITNKQARIILSALEEINMFTAPSIQQKIFDGDGVEKICIIFTDINHKRQEEKICLGYLSIESGKILLSTHSQKFYQERVQKIRTKLLQKIKFMPNVIPLNSRPEIVPYISCDGNKC
jgi:hypothetical protein